MISVLVVAKSAVSRAGLVALVRADGRFEVVGEGQHHGTLIQLARQLQPSVIVMEAADVHDLATLQPMLQQPGSPGVVLLANLMGRVELRRALQSGVRAVLPGDSSPAEIVAAIEAVAAGLAVLTEDDVDALLPAAVPAGADDDYETVERLTRREIEILGMLSEGAGNKRIAARLNISEHTVKFHVSSILAKLGATTRTEAVSRGFRDGLIVM